MLTWLLIVSEDKNNDSAISEFFMPWIMQRRTSCFRSDSGSINSGGCLMLAVAAARTDFV